MVTLKQIAEKAGVAPGTVSRILNMDKTLNVSEKTRETVLKVAEEMDYQKKMQRKRAQKRYTIGVVCWYNQKQELDDPYYLSIRLAVEKKCKEQKLLYHILDLQQLDKKQLQEVDGLIAIGKFGQEDIRSFEMTIPHIVFVDCCPNEKKYDSVVVNYESGVFEALEHLYEEGHRHIGYIGGSEWINHQEEALTDERESAYQRWMEAKQLADKVCLFKGQYCAEEGYRLMQQALAAHNRPTAFFIASDPMAIGAYRAVAEAGLSIPKDISIVGFDDIQTAKFLVPSLTTVKVYTEYMGVTGVELLVDSLNTQREVHKKISLSTVLCKRESIGKER